MNLEQIIERLTSILFALIALACIVLTVAHSYDPFVPYVTGMIAVVGGVGSWATYKKVER